MRRSISASTSSGSSRRAPGGVAGDHMLANLVAQLVVVGGGARHPGQLGLESTGASPCARERVASVEHLADVLGAVVRQTPPGDGARPRPIPPPPIASVARPLAMSV